jgi:hypothetical protein
MGYGLWIMGYGLWVMGYTLWDIVGYKFRNMVSGLRVQGPFSPGP